MKRELCYGIHELVPVEWPLSLVIVTWKLLFFLSSENGFSWNIKLVTLTPIVHTSYEKSTFTQTEYVILTRVPARICRRKRREMKKFLSWHQISIYQSGVKTDLKKKVNKRILTMFHLTLQNVERGKISQFITPLLCVEWIFNLCSYFFLLHCLHWFAYHCCHSTGLTIASDLATGDLISVEIVRVEDHLFLLSRDPHQMSISRTRIVE